MSNIKLHKAARTSTIARSSYHSHLKCLDTNNSHLVLVFSPLTMTLHRLVTVCTGNDHCVHGILFGVVQSLIVKGIKITANKLGAFV